MSIMIRKMTSEEFEAFCQWSMEHHAKELMDQLQISGEEALKKAAEELLGMLPDGLHTKHNYFMTVIEADREEAVGFIWTIHEETDGRKQSFICDFAIWEPERRKGYGAAALALAEKHAAEALCRESVLFVADGNTAARALYQKCGYGFLRQKDYGKYMVKQLL